MVIYLEPHSSLQKSRDGKRSLALSASATPPDRLFLFSDLHWGGHLLSPPRTQQDRSHPSMLSCPHVLCREPGLLCFSLARGTQCLQPPPHPTLRGCAMWVTAGAPTSLWTVMPPWGSATRCVDRRDPARLVHRRPAVRQLGRNTREGGHLWLWGRERAQRPVGDMAYGCGCRVLGVLGSGGDFLLHQVGPLFPLAHLPVKMLSDLGSWVHLSQLSAPEFLHGWHLPPPRLCDGSWRGLGPTLQGLRPLGCPQGLAWYCR